MVPLPIIFLVFLLLTFVARPLVTLCHELGHGIAALLFTASEVTLYVGSYGDPNGNAELKLGRLRLFLKYNPKLWATGLCSYDAQAVSLNRNILITVAGPLAALLLCLLITGAAVKSDLPGGYKVAVLLFMAQSLYEFLRNIIPSDRPIRLHDGRHTYNDGRLLVALIEYYKMPPEAQSVLPLYQSGAFGAAGEQLQRVIDSGCESSSVYRLAISAFLLSETYDRAESLNEAFLARYKGNSDDYSNAGLIKARLDKNEEALQYFHQSLRLNPRNGFTLVNRGYVFLLLNRYEEAIGDFNRALFLGHEVAYAYCSRGLAKIKGGNTLEGLADIHLSLETDSNNSYAYRNLGIYHLDREEFAQALSNFEKAYKLDKKTHLLEAYMDKARQAIQEAGQEIWEVS